MPMQATHVLHARFTCSRLLQTITRAQFSHAWQQTVCVQTEHQRISTRHVPLWPTHGALSTSMESLLVLCCGRSTGSTQAVKLTFPGSRQRLEYCGRCRHATLSCAMRDTAQMVTSFSNQEPHTPTTGSDKFSECCVRHHLLQAPALSSCTCICSQQPPQS